MQEIPERRPILSRRILAVLGVLAVMAWVCSAAAVIWYATHDQAAPSDAIIVMGAAHYQGRPSPVLRSRLDHAYDLHTRGLAPRIVLTGGTAEGDTASEASVSRVYLVRAGIADTVLLLENDGRTSSQSLKAAASILEAHGMTTVILVSDQFHMLRAGILARRHGLEVRTSPTRTDGVWRRIVNQPSYFLGETIKAPIALLMDW